MTETRKRFKQDPNKTPETDLEGFQNQGGYAPETPPRKRRRTSKQNRTQGDAAQRRAEAARGGKPLKPEEIWPNYPQMNYRKEALKILKLLPAKALQAGRLGLTIAGSGLGMGRYR